MGVLYYKASERFLSWKVLNRLPAGLSFDTYKGELSGAPIRELPPTVFTIQAVKSEVAVNVTLTITIAPCPYGSLLYPNFTSYSSGIFTLFDNGKPVYNRTLTNRDTRANAICLPKQDYSYFFDCSGSFNHCYLYIEDDKGLVYLSVQVMPMNPKEGTMKMIPTEIPSISVPSLVTLYQNEVAYIDLKVTGLYDSITVEPPLPSQLVLVEKAALIKGSIKESVMREYTLTISNPLGKYSTTFTIAMDQCPQGLDLLQVKLDRHSLFEHWTIFNSQNELLFDQKNDDRSPTHNVCWTPGSYRFDLSTGTVPGWYTSSRLSVTDDLGLLAEFKLPDDAFEASRHFTFDYLVPSKSEWKMKRGSVSGKWTKARYNDKKWEIGSDGSWGEFSQDVSSMFLRRGFSIDASKFTYLHIDVKRSADCEVIAYLNEQEVGHLISNSTDRMRITLFASSLPSSSLLAVEVRRAAGSSVTAPIVFDAKVTATSSGCVIQTVGGVAWGNQDSDAEYAFNLKKESSWRVRRFPVILGYTFKNAAVAVNRASLTVGSYSVPRSIRVEGVNADNSTVTLYSVSEPQLLHNKFLTMDFENSRAFTSYRFVFEDPINEEYFYVTDARFYSCMDRRCRQKSGYPVTPTGVTRYGRCPFMTTGTKQMHCVEGDNVAFWSEDRSACVKKIPQKELSFVDWVFQTDGVTMEYWEKKVQEILVGILLSNLRVAEQEIRFVSVVDVSSTNVTLSVFSRFTLEVEIGDYILKHFKMFEPNLNAELARKLRGVSIATVSMKLREPINVSTIVVVCVTSVIVLLLIAVIFLVRLRIKSMKRKKSLKHMRGEAGLLAESV